MYMTVYKLIHYGGYHRADILSQSLVLGFLTVRESTILMIKKRAGHVLLHTLLLNKSVLYSQLIDIADITAIFRISWIILFPSF